MEKQAKSRKQTPDVSNWDHSTVSKGIPKYSAYNDNHCLSFKKSWAIQAIRKISKGNKIVQVTEEDCEELMTELKAIYVAKEIPENLSNYFFDAIS